VGSRGQDNINVRVAPPTGCREVIEVSVQVVRVVHEKPARLAAVADTRAGKSA
jgi:hypothetical protein